MLCPRALLPLALALGCAAAPAEAPAPAPEVCALPPLSPGPGAQPDTQCLLQRSAGRLPRARSEPGQAPPPDRPNLFVDAAAAAEAAAEVSERSSEQAAAAAEAALAAAEAAARQGNASADKAAEEGEARAAAAAAAAEAAEAAEDAAVAASHGQSKAVQKVEEMAAEAARAAAAAARDAALGNASSNVTAAEEVAEKYAEAAETAEVGADDQLVKVQEAIRKIWKRLQRVSRYGSQWPDDLGALAIDGFGWGLFCGSVAMFVLVHCVQATCARDRSDMNSMILFVWAALACSCFVLVYWQYGSRKASIWLDGYLLELVFMLDNIFVLHIIVKPFRLPWRTTYLALVATVLFQLMCSTIFYLVLADKLKALEWLQYLLGVSLLFAAYQAVSVGEDDDFDIMETRSVKFVKQQLGDRLVAQPAQACPSGGSDLAVVTTNGEGQLCLTMGGLMLACLLAADFVLEIDVTLSKIDELQDRYLCLSSSALAAFAMPDIFRLAEGLFRRYSGLKYAVGFVLLFIGVQMLLHRLFTIPALIGVGIIVAAVCLSIAASAVLGWGACGGDAPSSPLRA